MLDLLFVVLVYVPYKVGPERQGLGLSIKLVKRLDKNSEKTVRK